MYTVTSIRRDEHVPLYAFCREPPRTLSPVVSEYLTTTPPTSKADVLALEHEDLVVQRCVHKDDKDDKDALVTRPLPRLVVFDMDSTLIQEECIDLLAAHAGVEAEVSAITARAMNGELDFTASLAARVSMLAGLSEDALEEVRRSITFSPGARALCRALRRLGCHLVLCSGGFTALATTVQRELGIDEVYANVLEVQDGHLTGRTLGPVVDGARKRDVLVETQKRLQCQLAQVVAVGDGANDLPMLHAAGLGVAIHAKEKVQREAPARIRFGDLSTILYLFGISEEEINKLCSP